MNERSLSRNRAVLVMALLGLFTAGLIAVGFTLAPGVTMFGPRPLPTLSPQGHNLAISENQRRGRPVQALYHVEALAARVGWTADLHQQAGDLWHRLGDDDRALFHWQQATPNPVLLRRTGEVYLQRGDWDAAADTLEQLIALQSDDTWANFHLGMIRAPLNPPTAEPYLRQAALDPLYNEAARAVRVTIIDSEAQAEIDETRLPMLIGLTMIEHDLWPYAELAFEQANTLALTVSGEPLPEALAYMSLAQDRQGKNGEEAILAAVRLRPNDAQIRFLLGLHFRYVGNYQASLDALVQAVGLSPENPALYAELGTAYRLVGDLEQAEEWFKAAVAYSDSAPEYQRLLALFYAEEAYNLGSSGMAALNDTLGVMPNDPDLLAGMGWALFTLGDQEAGREQVEAALEIDPNNPRALFYKARMLLVTEENSQLAVRLLEQVAATDTTFSEEAQRVLETLG